MLTRLYLDAAMRGGTSCGKEEGMGGGREGEREGRERLTLTS
jgi:hypothetical protein